MSAKEFTTLHTLSLRKIFRTKTEYLHSRTPTLTNYTLTLNKVHDEKIITITNNFCAPRGGSFLIRALLIICRVLLYLFRMISYFSQLISKRI